MTVRRKRNLKKQKDAGGLPQAKALETTAINPAPDCEPKEKPQAKNSLPVSAVLEILAGEYTGGAGDEPLCRAAHRIAAEAGVLDIYRAKWNAEEEAGGERLPFLLFDRRQCLELIDFHRRKGNTESARRESERLVLIEGRLLLERSSPARITDEDIAVLEEFIKECGF